MGQILGITGAIGSGKSTLTKLLADQEPSNARYESGELIAELAEDFNRALSGELAFETTHDPIELVNQSLIWFVEAISDKLHQDPSWSQLAITKYQVATHPELFDKIFQYIAAAKKQPDLLDGRITHDNKDSYRPLLQWLGAYLVAKVSPAIWYDEIFRRINLHDADKKLVIINGLRYPSDASIVHDNGGLVITIERPLEETDLQDPTEASRSLISPDVTVHNNGTIKQLADLAEIIWNDLSISKHKNKYFAV